MTLSTAIRTANSSLSSHAQHISNISRNISGIGDPTYVRRNTDVLTTTLGGTRVETQRYVNRSVYTAMISSQADTARAEVLSVGYNRLSGLQGTNSFTFSPAKLLGDLQQSVDFAASAPADSAALTTMIEQARTVANTMNSHYSEVLSMKEVADKEIGQSVERINLLLGQIQQANEEVVNGTLVGTDVFDSMDNRDRLINELSEEIGIKVISGENNSTIITTTSGAMLFESVPREVSFEATASYGANTVGNELIIDGLTVSGPNATLKIDTGKIAGNLELRDEVLTAQQNQLDEIARGLIEIFAEEDGTGGGKPPLAGLFTWNGGPAIPTTGVLSAGIASSITLNPLADTQTGGDPTLIRDGALNGDPDYQYNTAGGPAFSDRLYDISAAFDVTATFDAITELPSSQSLNSFASSAVDFLNSQRAASLNEYSYRAELSTQFQQAMQNETGPNLDYEMSRLLEVERAYQATARVISTVDEMLATLLQAVG
ncbi:MAG: flagellar hook-associated protein FlgK [Pseudomonadota bacterium]